MDNPGPAGILQLQELLTRIINLSVGISFMVLLVMLVYGGVRFIISGGEPKAVQAATQTLTYAVIGIVLLAVAWLILKLISAFTGVDLTHFCLGFPGALTNCP